MPKTGTTSLDEYLNKHPKCSMSRPKEPAYFASDFDKMRKYHERKDYEQSFLHSKQDDLLGDASVLYSISSSALEEIKEYNPQAKIIFILRDPNTLIPSWHSQNLFTCDEDIEDLINALAVNDDRKNGEYIPEKCRDRKLLDYESLIFQSKIILNLRSNFPVENILILQYEELETNANSFIDKVHTFLSIDKQDSIQFPKINTRKNVRSKSFAKFVARPPKIIKTIWNYLNNLSFLKKTNFLRVLASHIERINYVATKRKKK